MTDNYIVVKDKNVGVVSYGYIVNLTVLRRHQKGVTLH
jgi:hypothetical protein